MLRTETALALLIVACVSTPAEADKDKKDEQNWGGIVVENDTPFAVRVEIRYGGQQVAAEDLEPEGQLRRNGFTGEEEHVAIIATGLEPPIDGRRTSLTHFLGPDGDCDRIHARYSNGAFSIEDTSLPCTAAILRETTVLACTSFGFLILAFTGCRLGRPPRPRTQLPEDE